MCENTSAGAQVRLRRYFYIVVFLKMNMLKNIRLTGGKQKMTKGKVYGYVRVSTAQQHQDRQYIAIKKYGVPEENIFAGTEF